MAKTLSAAAPPRPERIGHAPLPELPKVEGMSADGASVTYSYYRTGLSHLRTELSEHRTDLSEHRTDLSGERTEMSMRRTGMSFQRTRMSADRTLMSVIRTSLSLIGFGFTIYQVFQKAHEAGIIRSAGAPRDFGAALLILGVLLLIGGIVHHIRFAMELRHMRGVMKLGGLVHADSRFPVSITFLVAVALLVIGLWAGLSIVLDIAPFA